MNNSDITKYIIDNSTLIKNNLMNKISDDMNLMLLIFDILNENNEEKNYNILKKYIDENKNKFYNNDSKDFISIISIINMFVNKTNNYDVNNQKRIIKTKIHNYL